LDLGRRVENWDFIIQDRVLTIDSRDLNLTYSYIWVYDMPVARSFFARNIGLFLLLAFFWVVIDVITKASRLHANDIAAIRKKEEDLHDDIFVVRADKSQFTSMGITIIITIVLIVILLFVADNMVLADPFYMLAVVIGFVTISRILVLIRIAMPRRCEVELKRLCCKSLP